MLSSLWTLCLSSPPTMSSRQATCRGQSCPPLALSSLLLLSFSAVRHLQSPVARLTSSVSLCHRPDVMQPLTSLHLPQHSAETRRPRTSSLCSRRLTIALLPTPSVNRQSRPGLDDTFATRPSPYAASALAVEVHRARCTRACPTSPRTRLVDPL